MRTINVLATQRISADDRAKIEASDPAIRLIDAGGWFDGEIRETWAAFAAARYLPAGATGSGSREERNRLLAEAEMIIGGWPFPAPRWHSLGYLAKPVITAHCRRHQAPAPRRRAGLGSRQAGRRRNGLARGTLCPTRGGRIRLRSAPINGMRLVAGGGLPVFDILIELGKVFDCATCIRPQPAHGRDRRDSETEGSNGGGLLE
jgi:hypothetical protein